MVDENNTLTLRCRVICQEDSASYNPHLRIISTKDGKRYRHGSPNLYEVEESLSDNICNTASPIRDYEYRITVLNDTFNESIAMCGLFYQSSSESFTEYCYIPILVWILLPTRPTMMSPTPATPPQPPCTCNTTTPGPVVGSRIGPIPEGASIFFILMAAVCICAMAVLIGGVVFLYKRARKTPKRKISAQVTQDGSAVRRPHGGFYSTEDMESDHNMDDTRTGHHTTSNLTLRH